MIRSLQRGTVGSGEAGGGGEEPNHFMNLKVMFGKGAHFIVCPLPTPLGFFSFEMKSRCLLSPAESPKAEFWERLCSELREPSG